MEVLFDQRMVIYLIQIEQKNSLHRKMWSIVIESVDTFLRPPRLASIHNDTKDIVSWRLLQNKLRCL